MNMMKESISANPPKFYCSSAALLLGLISCVLYLATGVIRGFTDQYSIALIVFGVIGVLSNVFFTVKRMDTFEMLPFVCYVICIFLFFAVNANYLVAVIRQIDVTSVSGTFVATAVLFAAAAVMYLVSFAFVKDKE